MSSSTIGQLRIILAAYVAEFKGDMDEARHKVIDFGEAVQGVGKATTKLGDDLQKKLTLPLLAAAGAALKFGGDFEASLNGIGANLRATESEMTALKSSVLDVSREAGTGLSETATVFDVLSGKGVDLADIMGGVGQAGATVARALGTDAKDGAEAAALAMKSFERSAVLAETTADRIVGTTMVAGVELREYTAAVEGSGRAIKNLGGDFEDFNAALVALKPGFDSAQSAASSYRTFLQRLAPSSREARDAIKTLGLEFFDAEGRMKGLPALAEELRTKLSGLTAEAQQQALLKIFGDEGMRTAILLMSQGAAGIQTLKDEIASYSATEQSAMRNRGFNEQLKQFRNEVVRLTVAIAESGLLEFVTSLIRRLTDFVARIADTNPELLKFAVTVGAVVAAAGPVIAIFGGMISVVGKLAVAYSMLMPAVAAAKVGIAAFAATTAGSIVGITGMALAVGNLTYQLVKNSEWGQKAGRSLGIWFAELKYGKEEVAAALKEIEAQERAMKRINELADGAQSMFAGEEEKERREEIERLQAAAEKAAAELDRLTGSGELADPAMVTKMQELRDSIYPVQHAIREFETSLAAAAKAGIPAEDATDRLAKIAYDAAGGYEALKGEIDKLPDPLRRLAEADKAVADLKVAKSAERLRQQVNSLDRQIYALASGGLSDLETALGSIDMQYDQTKERINGLIETNRALAAESPSAAAALAELEAQLKSLDAAYGLATDSAIAQVEAQNRLRDAAAEIAAQDIRREIQDLQQARGDAGVITSTQREMQDIERELQIRREEAAMRLLELETQRDEAVRTNNAEEAERLTGLIDLQRVLYGEVEQTTATQIYAAGRIQDMYETLTDDLSSSLATMISEWRFDLDSIRRIFQDMAKEEFIQPFLKDFAGGLTEGLGGLFKGFGGGGTGGAGGAGGGGLFAQIGGFFKSFGGFFAKGGTLGPGEWGIAGENGPEPIFGGRAGMEVMPSAAMRGGVTMIVNTPNADSFRKSERQIVQGYRRALGE